MRVLVTGARGFIGTHLCAHLLTESGRQVVGIDRADGDLSEPGVASYLIGRHQPDVVVHLAGQVGREFGDKDAPFTIRSNVTAMALVAHACKEQGARLMAASTSEVYGDAEALGLTASDRLLESLPDELVTIADTIGGTEHQTYLGYPLPYNLYGLSKRWGEEVARLIHPKGLDLLRFSMPYGPGLPPGRGRAAIVNMLAQAYHGDPIIVHRGAERCWCWIGDTVAGVAAIMRWRNLPQSGEQPEAWNIGRDTGCVTMAVVAETARELVAERTADAAAPPYSTLSMIDAPANQVLVKRLPTDKLRRLGWEPHTELRDGMRMTLDAMIAAGHV